MNVSRIRFCIQGILGNNEGRITKQERQRGAELSNDCVICLSPSIFTALINSFMCIYLLTDAVSSDTQRWSHPVTVSLLKHGTGFRSGKRVSAQVGSLLSFLHDDIIVSLQQADPLSNTCCVYRRPASQKGSQLSALKRFKGHSSSPPQERGGMIKWAHVACQSRSIWTTDYFVSIKKMKIIFWTELGQRCRLYFRGQAKSS